MTKKFYIEKSFLDNKCFISKWKTRNQHRFHHSFLKEEEENTFTEVWIKIVEVNEFIDVIKKNFIKSSGSILNEKNNIRNSNQTSLSNIH